ncbi:PfkB family carbohydrate kinase [Mycoplasmopsis citelli]|uniref:PfkB family carbohydrate kinase n=1 Tax=Mycoplasmopsis citelli TaxID=171281 RepID=UPI0021158ED8|nr:PfkB family carbohydrate kinase [Mycoplasmopsis citelli]UUD35792.1 PfkB family carbohydrate kinase [Mycoplasmopsis citelli]
MIYTLTLSPSVDLFISSEDFELSKVNRYTKHEILPGGKGLNASVILTRHNFKNKAITLFDPNTFRQLAPIFEAEQLDIVNINTEQPTRINIKYYGAKSNFELNGPRTNITEKLFKQVLNVISTFKENDVLMLMGVSSEEHLVKILSLCKEKKVKVVLDVESSNFLELLKYQPFVIKPNIDELKKIFPTINFNETENLINAMRKLQNSGALNVIVSLGKDGSYLLTQSQEIFVAENKETTSLVSATGAGDTLISIFAAEYLNNQNASYCLQKASAAATGTVQSSWLGDQNLTNLAFELINLKKIKS